MASAPGTLETRDNKQHIYLMHHTDYNQLDESNVSLAHVSVFEFRKLEQNEIINLMGSHYSHKESVSASKATSFQ